MKPLRASPYAPPKPSTSRSLRSAFSGRRRARSLAGIGDRGLLAAVAAGRIEAIEELYDRHADPLYRLALLVGGDPKLAEDAVAKTFLGLWRNARDSLVAGEALRVALAADVHARCTRARTTAGRSDSGPPRATPDVGASTVWTALAELPARERDLLGLIVFGCHSRAEAARRVGVSETAAASSVTAALRTIAAGVDADAAPGPTIEHARGHSRGARGVGDGRLDRVALAEYAREEGRGE